MTDTASQQAAVRPEDFAPCRMPLRARALPGEGEVHLWYLDLGELSAALKGALGGEQGGNSEKLTPGQLRFVRRFYLRLLLGSYLGVAGKDVAINRSHKGKPSVDRSVHDSPIEFSMAKSGDRLLIGVALEHFMGVDLEPACRHAHNPLGVARRYFSEAEAEELSGLQGDSLQAAFLRTWALKEAVVKASGLGIANQLCRFSVETRVDRAPAMLDMDGESSVGWSLALLEPEQGFLGAVALRSPQMNLSAFRLVAASH